MRRELAHPAVPPSLIESIVATYAPRRIILFGSAARGAAGPDSDLDLLVELDDDVPDALRHWRKAWEARAGYDGAVDIIPYRSAVLRSRSGVIGTLAHEAIQDGILIYERD